MPRSEIVYIGLPEHPFKQDPRQIKAIDQLQMRGIPTLVRRHDVSLLNFNFNTLFADALNMKKEIGITHWLLMHDDLWPEDPPEWWTKADKDGNPTDPCWLEVMLDTMSERGLDVLATNNAIKNRDGETSTAFEAEDGSSEPCRIPMPSFSDRDVWTRDNVPAGMRLLINTGLMLIDMRRPWVDSFPGFSSVDKIKRKHDGSAEAYVVPEDWSFSRWLDKNQIPYGCTNTIVTCHVGSYVYKNRERLCSHCGKGVGA